MSPRAQPDVDVCIRVQLPETDDPENMIDVGSIRYEHDTEQLVFYPDGDSTWLDERDLEAVLDLLRAKKGKKAKS